MGKGRQGNIEKSFRTLLEEKRQTRGVTRAILVSCSYAQRQNQVVLSAQKADGRKSWKGDRRIQ